MKKKGLLILSMVMAIIALMSVITSTYAWFTISASTKVDIFEITVNGDNAVSIGMLADNTTSELVEDYFVYESVTYDSDTGLWTGTTGLGNTVTLEFGDSDGVNQSKAVGTTTTSGTSWDSGFVPDHEVWKASAGSTDTTSSNPEVAVANEDYVKLDFGYRAAKSGTYGIYMKLKITTKDSKSTLAMNAALHYTFINNEDEEYIDREVFGTNGKGALKSSLTTGAFTYNSSTEQATAEYNFLLNGVGSYTGTPTELPYDGTGIQMCTLYLYIFGPDTDCNSAVTGTGVDIEITFYGIANTDTTEPVTYITAD